MLDINTMTEKYPFDLRDRLIDFAVRIIRLSEALPSNKTGNYIASQVLRCGTSPAANYGEAQSAESPADFIHKLKIAHKELRETLVWLTIIQKTNLLKTPDLLDPLIQETDELLAILFSSIRTKQQSTQKHRTTP